MIAALARESAQTQAVDPRCAEARWEGVDEWRSPLGMRRWISATNEPAQGLHLARIPQMALAKRTCVDLRALKWTPETSMAAGVDQRL